jgi:hypothetical protein
MKKHWIQNVVKHMKTGSFTHQAQQKHMTPKEFALDVQQHPQKYRMKTRRRAQFLKNIQYGRRKTSRRK